MNKPGLSHIRFIRMNAHMSEKNIKVTFTIILVIVSGLKTAFAGSPDCTVSLLFRQLETESLFIPKDFNYRPDIFKSQIFNPPFKISTDLRLCYFVADLQLADNEDISGNQTIKNKQAIKNNKKVWLWLALIFVFDATALIIFIYQKRKKKKYKPESVATVADLNALDINKKNLSVQKEDYPNTIFLFGNFQFLQNGVEISNKFSPLLKELFLLIILHSSGKNKGITTTNLIDKLWADMSDKNARNNMAVNIGKLRAILGPDFHEILVNQSGSWKFETDENKPVLYCDYFKCLDILEIKREYSFADIELLISIIHKGGLLVNFNYEWLDVFKANVSNTIIDTLLVFATKNKENVSPDFLIKIADTIMLFDMVNENAMELKCKAFVSMGKHSMVNDTYSKFIREYKILYDVEYPRSLKSVIG